MMLINFTQKAFQDYFLFHDLIIMRYFFKYLAFKDLILRSLFITYVIIK